MRNSNGVSANSVRAARRFNPETRRFRRSAAGATRSRLASAAITGRCSDWISVISRFPVPACAGVLAARWSPTRPRPMAAVAESTCTTAVRRSGRRKIASSLPVRANRLVISRRSLVRETLRCALVSFTFLDISNVYGLKTELLADAHIDPETVLFLRRLQHDAVGLDEVLTKRISV